MSSLRSYFDDATIRLMRDALEETWSLLQPQQRQTIQRTDLATRILVAAGNGERDPKRLRAQALHSDPLANFEL